MTATERLAAMARIPASLIWGEASRRPHLLQVGHRLRPQAAAQLGAAQRVQLVTMEVQPKPGSTPRLNITKIIFQGFKASGTGFKHSRSRLNVSI